MRKINAIILSLFVTLTTFGQVKMRPLEELINTEDPGWSLVKEWIKTAKNKVEILPVDTTRAKEALFKTQVTTRSPMGSVVFMTGGLLIDNGWIRILGSGQARLPRTLPDWNKGKSFQEFGEAPNFLLIADDAIGGFFLLNGGGLGKDLGKVYYLSPDNLEYEPLDLTYTDFLFFCFNNNLDKFYKGYRWTNWKEEVKTLSGDKTFNFFPPLWTKEGKDMKKVSRRAIPVEEQYSFSLEMRKQLGIQK
ncbi:DUF2625 domain-containing protein [Aridibaculum aurantiacum]|uniref:DUF2625 domain-containing protein n=1 Tax=Aridibaculum aurantiacum TaxID=2810307 RepID=UPI001A97C7D8|nr:DUF2625 domain-containing protein [Aridibaculum aurantiacum]